MKKIISLFLSACLIFSALAAVSSAALAADSEGTDLKTVRALGIMVGDENGNLNLGNYVTRAEFAKMMVAASTFKDSVGAASGYSTFSDVKQDHWAAPYIKVAVSSGWFVGYSDGTFQPNNNINLQEAATALLRLLGYTASTDLIGTYPYAQLAKFSALGLNENLTKNGEDLLTRSDCVTIFYNLMTTQTKSNTPYGKSLGYAMTASNELDYASLVSTNMKGPYVLGSGASISSLLPFSASNVSVYKNGVASDLSSAVAYDVFYYNANLRTVWIYNTRVIGTYTAASPNRVSPTAVTVAGTSYTLGTTASTYKMSSLGSFSIGDTVTLLLGMNGTVVDVFKPDSMNQSGETIVYYGVVTSSAQSSYTDGSGNAVTKNYIKVACVDGVTRQFEGSAPAGTLVSITVSGSEISVSRLAAKSTSGLISGDGTRFGDYLFSGDIKIMDTNSRNTYAIIYPSRLAGKLLSPNDVRYYETDSSGKISVLILNDVTGDMYSYGVITSITDNSASAPPTIKYTYKYMINGASGNITDTTTKFQVSGGPAIFYYNGSNIGYMLNLSSVQIDSLTALYANGNGQKYALAENVQVYLRTGLVYSPASISTVSDLDKYSLTGYYDSFGLSAGGRIRVIIATAK